MYYFNLTSPRLSRLAPRVLSLHSHFFRFNYYNSHFIHIIEYYVLILLYFCIVHLVLLNFNYQPIQLTIKLNVMCKVENQAVSQQNEKTIMVYCVIRYGQLIGCYESYEDASFVQRTSVEKGQLCDLVPKPLLKTMHHV